jgi:hypothetical protein
MNDFARRRWHVRREFDRTSRSVSLCTANDGAVRSTDLTKRIMRKASLPDVTLRPIECPRCDRCQTRMMVARIAPLPDGAEQRTFECPKCDLTETMTVADPLKSEAVGRLATNVRPPG